MAAMPYQIASSEKNTSGSTRRPAVQKPSATEGGRDRIIHPYLKSLGKRIMLALMICGKPSDFLVLC